MLANSPAKFPPISYAERVKKSSNTKVPAQGPSQRPTVLAQVPSSPTGATQPSSIMDNASVSTDTVPNAPNNSNSGKIQLSVQPTEPADTKITNGDASQEKSSVPQPSPQKPSVVNVWDIRKEQFAAARASASRVPQSKSLQLNPSSSSAVSALPPSSRSTDAVPAPSYKHLNGSLPHSASQDDDPFVVRVPARPPPAPTEDEESWPEVGKSVPTGSSSHPAVEKTNDAQTPENPPSTVTPPKKTEKTKWVPIPAQELQEAADAALKSQRSSHSRNQSLLSNRPRQGPSSTSGSVHDQSKPHSGRNSTSQSRVQSRTGSVQSSPRLPRGRRLPNEEMAGFEYPTQSENLLLRNSRVGSPQISPQSSRQPFIEPNVNIPPYSQGLFSLPPVNGIHTYFGHPPPPSSLPHIPSPVQGPPYPSHSPSNSIQSSFGHSGNESPNYSNQSLQALPPPPVPGYPGMPAPYPMYQPHQYDYSQGPGQPYLYWNGSGHNTPPYPPPHLSQYPVSHIQPTHFPPPPPPPSTLPVSDSAVTTTTSRPPPPEESEPVAGIKSLQTKDQPVIFGTIGVPGASQAPSPAPQSNKEEEMTSIERSFTAFSIGVSPGDRIRTRNRKGTKSDALADVTNGDPAEHVNGTTTIIDLTDRKWQFGTTAQADSEIPPASDDSPSAPAVPQPVDSAPQRVPDLSGPPLAPVQQSPLILASSLPSISSPPPIQPMPPSLIPPPFAVLGASLSPLDVESSGGRTEWEVQDFGFGFGHASGTGYAVALSREQMEARERERIREREVDRERIEAQREFDNNMENMGFREPEFVGRPRRGSYNGGSTFFDSRGSRRGGRGFSRGGGRRGGGDRFPNQSSRFSLTPPETFQAPGPMVDPSGFYPQATPAAPYMVPGYEGFQPTAPQPAPVPVPLTQPSFPLDSMRWFLLGQLEYYLSPQNMAQDFFLRQQMDSRGWISIPLLASFNRVKSLAADVSLVRDVLVLSSIAEVRDEWVRMSGWEQFVLPDAAQSRVEEGYAMHEQDHTETEDEEEEEVEFVMGREAALWTPERRS